MPSLCETRWLARVDAISCLLAKYEQVIEALREIEEESCTQDASDAHSYILSLESFPFIFFAVVTQTILAAIRPLSVLLQSIDIDLFSAHEEATNLVTILQKMRGDDYFDRVYSRANNFARQIHGEHFEPQPTRVCNRSMHRPNAQSTSTKDNSKINIYNVFIR